MPVRDIAKIKKDGKSHLCQGGLENKILLDYWDFQSKNLGEKLKQTGKKIIKEKVGYSNQLRFCQATAVLSKNRGPWYLLFKHPISEAGGRHTDIFLEN